MIKVFTLNKEGKIEFTKGELESLLNEVWNDGKNQNWYWHSPSITYPLYTNTTITCNASDFATNTTIDKDKVSIEVGESGEVGCD